MEYNEFKEKIQYELIKRFKEEGKTTTAEIVSVKKINQTQEALQIFSENPDSKTGICVAPSIDLHYLYEEYHKRPDINRILDHIIAITGYTIAEAGKSSNEMKLSQMKDQVIVTLVNTEKNRALLNEVPHREILDLSIIYRWMITQREDEFFSTVVTKALQKAAGMTERELEAAAWNNTQRLFPPIWGALEGSPLYLITNAHNMNGAAGLLCRELLKELADYLESDLYLIPSSIHEILAISVHELDLKELRDQLIDANQVVVSPGEVLSNNIYRFDRSSGKLYIAEYKNRS